MKNIFFISDMHFGHQNMCSFLNYDGTKARAFNNYLEADETMIQNWNDMVHDEDVVYVLGDVAYSCRKEYADSILVRLKGQKKLIAGNHDLWSTQWYLKHFKYVRATSHMDNFFFSHIPIHRDSRGRFKLCVHGHIHNADVMYCDKDGNYVKDPFYYNVCVDYHYRYRPVPYEDIQQYYQRCLDDGLLEPILPKERRTDIIEEEHNDSSN